MAGSDQACDAAFRQSGVIRVEKLDELFNLAKAFSVQELPLGPNLGIVTNAGGPGILAADACGESVMRMPTFPPARLGSYSACFRATHPFTTPLIFLAMPMLKVMAGLCALWGMILL
ncbi:acetate--CoA ligase [Aduncisulcus paluster]|uniref:Acetate--CoA ligase n=1 Tax=Aduncisulcus paluster TaxID=2918883 RepID=A0ABQ5KFU1_9EUKA|nr:acetate--CoA ligase [Aduncisulcus paluster]